MPRKKVIFHIGAPKTGTTYLQSFLSQNVSFLNSQGIDYPCAETQATIQAGACVGNLVRLMFLSELFDNRGELSKPFGFKRFWESKCIDKLSEVIEGSEYGTVLFSAEGMSNLDIGDINEIKTRLAIKYDIEIILFLRDSFDYFLSAWKQQFKVGGCQFDFIESLNRRINVDTPHHMYASFSNYKNSGMQLKVLNYDTFNSDLVGVFLKEVGIVERNQNATSYTAYSAIENRSLTDSESMLLLKVNQKFQGVQFPMFLTRLLTQRKDINYKQKKYYSREADKLILDRLAEDILEINKVIIGEPLRTTLRNDIEESFLVEEADLDVLMDAFKQVQDERNKKLTLKERIKRTCKSIVFKNVPSDFDPVAYIALNRDVEIAGVDPYQHYSRNGYREGRPYRYY